MFTAESFVVTSGDGAYNVAMRGRYVDGLMHKRGGGSREHVNVYDREEGSARLLTMKWAKTLETPIGSVPSRMSLWQLYLHSHLATTLGLLVSTCLGGAFIGSLFNGSIADGVGRRRRAFQLCALPMIIGSLRR